MKAVAIFLFLAIKSTLITVTVSGHDGGQT